VRRYAVLRWRSQARRSSCGTSTQRCQGGGMSPNADEMLLGN
jgi:hypothetical protein